jgi:catechol 2,3-dioxygenase-like lactoylglutathione lyase family enzyme
MGTILAHRGICVSNLERALRFYTDALGFSPTGDGLCDASVLGWLTGSAEPRLHTRLVRNEGGVTLELTQFDQPEASGSPTRRPLNKYGLTHFCFWTPSIEESAALLERCGGTPHWHTLVDFEPMNARVMYCSDPDGVRIEFGERPGRPFEFLHSGICTRDPALTTEFYAHVLNFKQVDQFDLQEHATWLAPLMELQNVRLSVRVLTGAGGARVELLQCHHPHPFGSRTAIPPNRLGLSHMTFSVRSVREASTKLEALSSAWQLYGNASLVCADPDGATVILLEKAA